LQKDNHANSTNSPIWSFTTAQALNNPPAIPSSPNPATAATGVSTSPTLSWSCSDPDAGDILTYDVYFAQQVIQQQLLPQTRQH